MTTLRRPPFVRSLSARLLLLTILFVMIAEVLIYVPSVARFRVEWLKDRLATAHLAALAVAAAPDAMVTEPLEKELLRHVGAYAVDVRTPDQRLLMLAQAELPPPDAAFDLAMEGVGTMIAESLRLLFNSTVRGEASQRVIQVQGPSPSDPSVHVAVLLRETPLCSALLGFSGRILVLSIIISVITAGLVYVSLIHMTVRPMRRLVEAMMAFRADPEDRAASAQLATDRQDEVGVAQRELIAMQEAVRQSLRQRERLAALGQAVAKINHDIRSILSSALLLSERLLESGDAEVRRNGPRILDSLERAAQLCSQTLAYSRDGVMPLQRQTVRLRAVVDEVLDTLGTAARPTAEDGPAGPLVRNEVAADAVAVVDRDQLFRALGNLVRNAVEAGATDIRLCSRQEPGRLTLLVSDNGPGLPPRARENLFQPFAGSTKPNGTGLGLAISREIARAHGGELVLVDSNGQGTRFSLTLPAAGMA